MLSSLTSFASTPSTSPRSSPSPAIASSPPEPTSSLSSSTSPSSFSEIGKTPVHVPGLPPFPTDHMILLVLDGENKTYKGFLHTGLHLLDCDGIIVNAIEALEPRALEAITARLHLLDCDGIIVIGLEKSEQRFLWVVRSPPSDNPTKYMVASPKWDLDVLMPKGFLERTRERGLVEKCWAPKVEVLRYESIGTGSLGQRVDSAELSGRKVRKLNSSHAPYHFLFVSIHA